MIFELLESTPIAGIFIFSTLVMFAFCEAGFQFSLRARAAQDEEEPASLGSMVGALLGMLGFVLAFTFSMAASQHDQRKSNVLAEANMIGTAYLRADLLDKSHGFEAKRLLREYVDLRLQATGVPNLEVGLAKSVEVHRLLQAQVAAAAEENPGTNTSLMIQAVNEVIDVHEIRVAGSFRSRIPGSVWLALSIITALTMTTLGMQVGASGNRRLAAVIPVLLAFSALIALVVDLNRPQSGLITVGQQSMVDLRTNMEYDVR